MLSWDLETDRFGPSNLAPEPVCVSVCDEEGKALLVASCEPEFEEVLVHCLESEMANTNISFDMACVLAHYPKLSDKIFDAYNSDRVHDLMIREKLYYLSTIGDLKYRVLPNGAKEEIGYSQMDMEKRRLGVDRSSEKEGEDIWRTNFSVLRGMPARDYPAEAREYALADARLGLQIYLHQQEQAKSLSWDPFAAQPMNARAAFALYLSSCWGFAVDREEVNRLIAQLGPLYRESAVEVTEDGKTVPLYANLLSSGILRPSVPMRPHARQLKKAIEMLNGVKPRDWARFRPELEERGIVFVEEVPSSYDQKALAKQVTAVCERIGLPVPKTEKGNVCFDAEVQEELSGLDPTLDEYIKRNEVKKLVTTELPRLENADRVHPRYDILKKTGRTSSYGNSKKDKNPSYPSVNIQQIDPRVRHAYVAMPGHALCSTDYSAIELVAIAERCLQLFGESVLADKIRAGMDPHAFLGAAIARRFDSGNFAGSEDLDENYYLFKELEVANEAYYKKFRGLAKPTGLGFPGGLGAARFVGYAKTTYGVDLVSLAGSIEGAIDMAKQLKKVWLETFPEMSKYFKFVTKELIDIEFSTPDETRYCYISPHGMVRRNCTYTEATNGFGLQTATAEGAKIALWMLAEAMFDPRKKSILLGSHMLAFIHDEVILEFPLDGFESARAAEASRIMLDGMRKVMTQLPLKAQPCLMLRWSKDAKPCFDAQGNLIPWQPRRP